MKLVFNKRLSSNLGEITFLDIWKARIGECDYGDYLSGKVFKRILFTWTEDALTKGNTK